MSQTTVYQPSGMQQLPREIVFHEVCTTFVSIICRKFVLFTHLEVHVSDLAYMQVRSFVNSVHKINRSKELSLYSLLTLWYMYLT